MIQNHPRGRAVQWTVDRKEELKKMVESHHVVISMLPYKYHVEVAKVCLEKNRHLVTTSYVKPEMAALDSEAKERGLVFLNELGLDPGIDHMISMRAIHEIKEKNGKVIKFYSYCGALPAPEYADNPFKYKFSWSPKGVVLAAKNSAKYLKDGKVIEVKSEDLFSDPFYIEVENVGKLEVYPNRDSLHYIELYSIEGTEDMFRGTLRYPGWSALWDGIKKLHLLDERIKDTQGLTYREFVADINNLNIENLEEEIIKKFGIEKDVVDKIKWTGILDDRKIPHEKISMFDLFVETLQKKLILKENEKDMVVMKNEITAKINGDNINYHLTLLDFGTPATDTSVARTVGIPAAIGAYLIASGIITTPGVHIPVIPEIYNPVLEELDRTGIKIDVKVEKTEKKEAG